jgi:hypothetical protein
LRTYADFPRKTRQVLWGGILRTYAIHLGKRRLKEQSAYLDDDSPRFGPLG